MRGGQAASSDGVDSLAADSIDVAWGGTTFDENTYLKIFFPPSPVTVVPEVETGALMLAGLASVGAISRRRGRGREAPSALIVDSRSEMERGLTSLSDPSRFWLPDLGSNQGPTDLSRSVASPADTGADAVLQPRGVKDAGTGRVRPV